jgi:hypothetical protein
MFAPSSMQKRRREKRSAPHIKNQHETAAELPVLFDPTIDCTVYAEIPSIRWRLRSHG